MDVTVAVGTFGDVAWVNLALDRAIPSAEALGVPIVHHHADTLHQARNGALRQVETGWVIFLDADDELSAGYIDRMAEAEGDVRVPLVSYIANGRAHRPRMPRVAGHHHRCDAECLPYGNFVVIGAAVRTDLVREVGGFEPWEVYEDWALWLRCHLAGATFQATTAVYRAWSRPDSRNRAPDMDTKNRVHHEIVDLILPGSVRAA